MLTEISIRIWLCYKIKDWKFDEFKWNFKLIHILLSSVAQLTANMTHVISIT